MIVFAKVSDKGIDHFLFSPNRLDHIYHLEFFNFPEKPLKEIQVHLLLLFFLKKKKFKHLS